MARDRFSAPLVVRLKLERWMQSLKLQIKSEYSSTTYSCISLEVHYILLPRALAVLPGGLLEGSGKKLPSANFVCDSGEQHNQRSCSQYGPEPSCALPSTTETMCTGTWLGVSLSSL
jgi:hypothetical protein